MQVKDGKLTLGMLTGGKLDDITVVVARVTSQPQLVVSTDEVESTQDAAESEDTRSRPQPEVEAQMEADVPEETPAPADKASG